MHNTPLTYKTSHLAMVFYDIARETSFVLLATSVLAVSYRVYSRRAQSKASCPIVGSAVLFGWVGAVQSLFRYTQLLSEGYHRYQGKPFQFPTVRGWNVFVSGKFIEEIRKAPEETLRFLGTADDLIGLRWTLGPSAVEHQWHFGVLRKQLTMDLGAVAPSMCDEIQQAFDQVLHVPEDGDWKAFRLEKPITEIVHRVFDRLCFGLPLCRDKTFSKLTNQAPDALLVHGIIIWAFPNFMRSSVAGILNRIPSSVRRYKAFVVPFIEQRQELAGVAANNIENWEKPNDLLQWLIDASKGEECSADGIAGRILVLYFAAINTVFVTFIHVVYYLAVNPKYISDLRGEIEGAIEEHAWTKDGLKAMVKTDSFIKESMRLSGLSAVSMTRTAIKTFTFSDGTTVDPGALISANAYSVHHDPSLYPNPDDFDPFRFARVAEEGKSSSKQPFTATSAEHLTFGYGTHACPGRFFASLELKAMVASLLLHYDVRLSTDGVRPKDRWIEQGCVPNPKAEVLFRKRQ